MDKRKKFIMWCDKVMVFSFYALIYFLPISIALSETFTAMALVFWVLKRGAMFLDNLTSTTLDKKSLSIFSAVCSFFKSFKPVSSYLSIPITIFLVFNFISVLTSQYRSISWEGFLGKALQNAFIYFNFIECMNSKKRLRIFLNVFFVSAFLISVNGLYQYYFGQGFIHGHVFEGRISSSFRHANDLGAYLVIGNAILLSILHYDLGNKIPFKKDIISHSVLLALTLGCIGLTYSRGAWIGLLFAAVFLGSQKRETVLINSVIIILFFSIFYPQLQQQRSMGLIKDVSLETKTEEDMESSEMSDVITELTTLEPAKQRPEVKATEEPIIERTMQAALASKPQKESFSHILGEQIAKIIGKIETSGRGGYWQEALHMLKDYPIFGVGLNAYSLVAPRYKINWGGYPHNCYLQMLVEIGVPGFLCFLWLLFRIFYNSIKNVKHTSGPLFKMLLLGTMAGFGGFLIHSFFDTFFYSVQLGSLMWVMMGFMVTLQNVKNCGGEKDPIEFRANNRIRLLSVSKRTTSMVSIILIFYIFLFFYIKRITLNPHYGNIFLNVGIQCSEQCSLEERLKYFKKAIYYNPNLSGAYFQVAQIYERMGNDQEAFKLYVKAAELDHANWEAYFKVGHYYFQKGELDYALRYFEQSYKHGSHLNEVNYYLGRVYEDKNRYKEAIQHFKVVEIYYERYDQALARKGALYHILGYNTPAMDAVVDLRKEHKDDLADQLQRFIEKDQYPSFMRVAD